MKRTWIWLREKIFSTSKNLVKINNVLIAKIKQNEDEPLSLINQQIILNNLIRIAKTKKESKKKELFVLPALSFKVKDIH